MCLHKLHELQTCLICIEPSDKDMLGGTGVVIVIDLVSFISNNNHQPMTLIGMAELKEMPMKTHFTCVDCNNNVDYNDLDSIIRREIAPGSWIVFEDRIFIEEYQRLLSDMYPVVVKRSQLDQHNTNEQKATDNLTLVWNHALRSNISRL